MTSSRAAKITALVLAILITVFGAAYVVAALFEIHWLQELLTPHFARLGLPFPWNLAALVVLVALGFVVNGNRKREQ